ncbi:MAG TPA: PDR/VanB family oxidoreductase [Trebonia sp.]|jgi:ferredoxin-NADP reductase|nr:PDR/VanB family oxidoreductase [Trebonia sp.]
MLDLLVRAARAVATDVISLELTGRDGAELPAWTPGAHIDLRLPSGLVRSYSLHGDPRDRGAYHVAVLNAPGGRGGSAEVHRIATAGAAISASAPRNAFALAPASHYLFLAGGIGVTPLLAMAREIARRREPWTFVYGGRSRDRMAFLDALADLPGGRLQVIPHDEAGLPDLESALAALPPGAAAYCCGPAPMLEAALAAAGRTRPDIPVRLERFTARPAADGGRADTAFEVELARSNITVAVPAGVSVLDAVRARIPGVMSSCEQGICSSCETAVLAGVPDHRDSVLTAKEQAANDYMMICVSRALTPRLVLDL